MDWHSAYRRLVETVPVASAAARPVACLTSSCIDIVVDLSATPPVESAIPQARQLLEALSDRMAKGIGGELVLDWPQGGAWVRKTFPHRLAWGGTGPHVAMALSALGAPSLTALTDRSSAMLSVVPQNVPLATENGVFPAGQVQNIAGKRHEVCVFEYTAGQPALGGITPRRSSRIIVRFTDLGIEDDPDFNRVTACAEFGIGAGLLGGFQCVPQAHLDNEYRRIAAIAGAWRDNGARLVHVELAGFTSPSLVHSMLNALEGVIDSVGMSRSEFCTYFGADGEPEAMASAMRATAERHGLERLCVHADSWMASLTRGDPEQERAALMLGALLAATRAATGEARRPEEIPKGAQIVDPPFLGGPATGYGYTLVAAPALYLPSPKTTLGMGDTFTAGCLLAFARHGKNQQESSVLTKVRSG